MHRQKNCCKRKINLERLERREVFSVAGIDADALAPDANPQETELAGQCGAPSAETFVATVIAGIPGEDPPDGDPPVDDPPVDDPPIEDPPGGGGVPPGGDPPIADPPGGGDPPIDDPPDPDPPGGGDVPPDDDTGNRPMNSTGTERFFANRKPTLETTSIDRASNVAATDAVFSEGADATSIVYIPLCHATTNNVPQMSGWRLGANSSTK